MASQTGPQRNLEPASGSERTKPERIASPIQMLLVTESRRARHKRMKATNSMNSRRLWPDLKCPKRADGPSNTMNQERVQLAEL